MGGRAQARAQAQNRAGVLGDVGLEEGDVHSNQVCSSRGRRAECRM
jgi:hypothetical protein